MTCKHYPLCGGCKSLEVPYPEQLQKKEVGIRQLFSALCREILPIIGSDPIFHYRGKMELSFSQTKVGEKFLGLRMSGKRGRVFLLEECHIAPLWMTEVVKAVYQWWQNASLEAYFPPKDQGALRTLTLREGDEGERMVLLTVSGREEYRLSEEELLCFQEAVQQVSPLLSIVLITQVTQAKQPTYFIERILYGKDHFTVSLDSLVCKVRPQAFFQPNRFTTALLYERVVALTESTKEDILYDLYCGTGTIGLSLAPFVKKVIGVELNPEAVKDARENIFLNRCANMEIYQKDVAHLKEDCSLERPTIIVMDPPRSGAGSKAIAHLLDLKPKKIVYVSCNPLTQLIDLQQLVAGGYTIQVMQPIDQFPHTNHVENIAVLVL